MPRASTTSDPFNAIAEPRRRHILEFIADEERSVGEIADALELEQPSVSKHLQVLRNVGLVTVRRDGRRTLYRTNAETLRTIHDWCRALRPALARPAAAHQGTRGGETMTTTAPVTESDVHHHRRHHACAPRWSRPLRRWSRRWDASTRRPTGRRCR